jgi:putative YjhG/YagF family dehydratase
MSDSMNLEDQLSLAPELADVLTRAPGPAGELPLTDELLRHAPSGNLFGMTQNVAMGWDPDRTTNPDVLILSTLGGIRADDGTPVALGYHTGHWEVGLLMREAANRLSQNNATPFAAYCSDPCDGRSQGTTAMFDSLAYRNDAATVMRRLIRSIPTRKGVIGVATCDKGLPATMMALAGTSQLPSVLIPGGVTLPPEDGEDAGKVQTIGARYSQGEMTLQEAAEAGCRACATPGGGCQFLGTAATAQVVAEALGLTVPHAALAPSGQGIWLHNAQRSADALLDMIQRGATRGGGGLDESAAAHPGDRARGGLASTQRGRLERDQPCRAASGRRAAERAGGALYGARVFGGRRAGNHAAPA